MESRDVFSQRELEEVLGQPDLIPICAGEGEFTVGGDHVVRAADSARLVVGDAVSVEAGGAAVVVAGGRTHVTARNSATVEAGDSATVIARNRSFVQARGHARVVAGGNSMVEAAENAFIVAIGRADVTAGDRCRVRALLSARLRLDGEARGWVWGRASVRTTDRAQVTAWGGATVFATGAADVEALEHAVVTADGTATVRAFGSVMVRARGRVKVEAASGVAVMRHGASGMPGAGVAEAVPPATPQEWCAFYGVPVEDGIAVLYKAVDENYDSYHGTSYRPGSMPSAADWDGGEQECGGGLHFSPRPTFALAAPMDEMRFVACPVRLADIAFHHRGFYPAKVKASGVCAPVYEVSEDGTAIASPLPSV
jgi:hypothetical protein